MRLPFALRPVILADHESLTEAVSRRKGSIDRGFLETNKFRMIDVDTYADSTFQLGKYALTEEGDIEFRPEASNSDAPLIPMVITEDHFLQATVGYFTRRSH